MEVYLNREGTKSFNSTLFKYVGIGQNLFSLLINSEVWFSDPNSFNDPYDCNLNYSYNGLKREMIYDYLLDASRKRGIESLFDVNGRTDFLFNNPKELKELGEKIIKNKINDVGISCFSESDNVLLMWSHYADSHKGICLTFEVGEEDMFFNSPYKVDYPAKYPEFNPFEGKNELQLLLATKSQEWAYEKEVRIIKDKFDGPNRGATRFNPQSLRAIKFGYKASAENIRTITNLIKLLYPKIEIYTSQLIRGQFGIEFTKLN
jgi:hypothetical protein